MMRYRLRTLLIVLAVGPMVMAFGYSVTKRPTAKPKPLLVVGSFSCYPADIRAFEQALANAPAVLPSSASARRARTRRRYPIATPQLVSGPTVLSLALADEPRVTAGITDIPMMVKVISAEVPAGTAIKDAQQFMEREGFTCTKGKGGWPNERDQYLYCDRHDKTSLFLVERVWKVAIFHRNGKVVKVAANTGLVGP